MGDWYLVIFVLAGAVIGGVYGLIIALKQKRSNKQDKNDNKNLTDKND